MRIQALAAALLALFMIPAGAAGAAGAAPTAPGRAVVTVAMSGEGAEAAVALDRPVTRFAFARADVVREGDFILLTPGLRLDGDAVVGSTPFRRFALRIRPMGGERDAKYPAHFRIGTGGVVYAPALKGDPAAWRTSFRFRPRPGETRLPARGDVDDGFVFIGPAALRSESDGIVAVADPGTPAWLVERTRAGLAAAVAAFTSALEAPLPRPPLLIVRHDDGPRSFNVGDVTPGAVTSLRFHGPAWAVRDEGAARAIQEFLFHEAFHFWNGGLASPARGTPAWLHEGGAEYAALLAGLEAGGIDEGGARARLSSALQRCRSGLRNEGDKPMAEIGFLSNQIRYPCGMVLQWAADLHLRRASGGERTILHAWRDMLRAARGRLSPNYSLADFYAAARIADPDSFAPLDLLVRRGGAERWKALGPALDALGAEIVRAPTPEGRRGAMLFHLLKQNCRGLPEGTSIGYYAEGGAIRLQAPAGCGVLTGDPSLKSIEGGDPHAGDEQTWEAVRRKCAAGETVTLLTADGRTLAAACAAPLPPAPDDFLVQRWLPPTAASTAAARQD